MASDLSPADEIQRFEEQYRRQPESLVFARLADAYRKAGKPGRALALLDDGLIRHPDYPSGHLVRARALRDLGRMDETLDAFRRVLDLDAQNLVAIRELAGLADERGDVDEARHWYERLVQIEPTSLEARRRLTELDEMGPAAEQGSPAEVADEDVPHADAGAWWDDSAVTRELAAEDATQDETGEAFWGADGVLEAPSPDPDEVRRPADEVVEAILNGEVPQTVRAEDTWWYEEAPDPEEPEPSRDADLLTRTMADLYAEQGLHREAMEVYDELLKASPDDPELLGRLEALRSEHAGEPEYPGAETGQPQDEVADQPEVASGSGSPAQTAPLGPPAGPPVAEELRRLLRLGEEAASRLPEPAGEVETGDAFEIESEVEQEVEPQAERAADSGTSGWAPGAFARQWIEGLEPDA